MRIVAHMMIFNEADIIRETLEEIDRWGGIEAIVVLDGGSTDGTIDVVRNFRDGSTNAEVALYVRPDPEDRFADHRRMELLNLTREYEPDWIISLDADEIYHTSPVDAIVAAEEEGKGANVIWCDVPQFWITLADIRAGLLLEEQPGKRGVSIQKRRRWYSWGHTGVFIWKDHPNHYYPIDVPKRTPEMQGVPDYHDWQVPGPVRPICKHYCFRTLGQAMRRMKTRLMRGGRKYFGKYALNWIIDEQACLLTRYGGGDWNEFYNHDLVGDYMGQVGRFR